MSGAYVYICVCLCIYKYIYIWYMFPESLEEEVRVASLFKIFFERKLRFVRCPLCSDFEGTGALSPVPPRKLLAEYHNDSRQHHQYITYIYII